MTQRQDKTHTPLIRPPLGLYIHLPWCVRKCPYCDFNSHALRDGLPEKAYVDALLADLRQDLAWVKDRRLHSIFLGGGTPSLFSPDSLARMLEGVQGLVPWDKPIEITLEANPGTVESAKFRAFRASGINRLSLGVQSFQDGKLTALGRIHTAREALEAIDTARSAGFDNFNLDLMFGLPGQSLNDALSDIDTAIAQNPAHISYYQLTLEPHTLFAKYPPRLPQDEHIWTLQNACQEKLAAGGFKRYEISAYARDGFQCRHNLNYWRFGDYLGIGAGAHAKLTDPERNAIHRIWKIRHPDHYREKAASPARIGGRSIIRESDKPLEFLMNTLRLKEGFTPSQFERRTGMDFAQIAPSLEPLLVDGLLKRAGERITCSSRGWNFLDTLLERFIPA